MYFEFLQELLFVWEAASNTRYSVSWVGLKKLNCALSLPLRIKYSLCLIRKRFSYLFPRKLMKVLSLSFTSNREDMFDLDSSLTRIAIVPINLIERIVTLFVWFVRSMWFIYQRDSDLSESVCEDLVLCSPSNKSVDCWTKATVCSFWMPWFSTTSSNPRQCWIEDSTPWIPESLSVELGFLDFGFHQQKFLAFRNADYLTWGEFRAMKTGRFDINSSSEIAQKFCSLQVQSENEQDKHFGWISSFFKPSTSNYFTPRLNKLLAKRLVSKQVCIETTGNQRDNYRFNPDNQCRCHSTIIWGDF